MDDLVVAQQNDQVFEIILNRPDKRNAINLRLYEQLDLAVQQADRTAGIRAVIIRGRGEVFSSGIDLAALLNFSQKFGPNWQQRMRSITHDFQAVLTKLERIEVPTIALLHGYCLGLAFEIALACDLKLAARGTKFGLPETRLGLIPDVGGTTRLTRIVGPTRAKEIIFTGRQFDAEIAAEWGIVNYVVSMENLSEKANQLIEEISLASPLAVGMVKRVIDGLADIDRGLQIEGWAQSQLFASEDFQEAVQAYMMKRPPEFKGR
jgi:enoyl-CoA hydratase/carnithine racemase